MLNARGINSNLSLKTEDISEKKYFYLKATNDFVIVFCNDKKPDIDSIINENKNITKKHIKMCVVTSDSDVKNSFKKKVI